MRTAGKCRRKHCSGLHVLAGLGRKPARRQQTAKLHMDLERRRFVGLRLGSEIKPKAILCEFRFRMRGNQHT